MHRLVAPTAVLHQLVRSNSETSQDADESKKEEEEEEDVIIDDDNENEEENNNKASGISPLVSAYAARLGNEADYARYRACKDSSSSLAEAFYSRLATLQALHSYGYYMNPLALSSLVSQYQQHQLANHLQTPSSPNNNITHSPSSSLLSPQFAQNSPTTSSTSSSCSASPSSSSTKIHNHHQNDLSPPPSKKVKLVNYNNNNSTPKKHSKASRKLNFDDYLTSPVSGTIIRELAEGEEIPAVRKGDIDPEFNVVEVTEEAKAELAKIVNKIGDFVCRLCREKYEDAFGLAQHRCSMIVHVEYRCPECDKVFNCPANLASHRRWHKPKQQGGAANGLQTPSSKMEQQQDNSCCSCEICGRTFKKYGTMRKHLQTHHQQEANNNSKTAAVTASSPNKSYSIDTLLSPTKEATKAAYSCHICRAVFQTGRQLESHCFEQCRPPPALPPPPPKEQQLPSPKQLISCPACPQLTFPDLNQLTRHAARFHLPPPPQQQLQLQNHQHQRFHFPLPSQASPPNSHTSLLSIAALASRS